MYRRGLNPRAHSIQSGPPDATSSIKLRQTEAFACSSCRVTDCAHRMPSARLRARALPTRSPWLRPMRPRFFKTPSQSRVGSVQRFEQRQRALEAGDRFRHDDSAIVGRFPARSRATASSTSPRRFRNRDDRGEQRFGVGVAAKNGVDATGEVGHGHAPSPVWCFVPHAPRAQRPLVSHPRPRSGQGLPRHSEHHQGVPPIRGVSSMGSPSRMGRAALIAAPARSGLPVCMNRIPSASAGIRCRDSEVETRRRAARRDRAEDRWRRSASPDHTSQRRTLDSGVSGRSSSRRSSSDSVCSVGPS